MSYKTGHVSIEINFRHEEEWQIDRIIGERMVKVGRGYRKEYRVLKWTGYSRETWTKVVLFEDTAALEAQHMVSAGGCHIPSSSGVFCYQEAAIALHLFRDNREAEYSLNEAIASYSSPSQLRFLFANLLLDLPFPAMELWDRFKEELCGDYLLRRNHRDSEN